MTKKKETSENQAAMQYYRLLAADADFKHKILI